MSASSMPALSVSSHPSSSSAPQTSFSIDVDQLLIESEVSRTKPSIYWETFGSCRSDLQKSYPSLFNGVLIKLIVAGFNSDFPQINLKFSLKHFLPCPKAEPFELLRAQLDQEFPALFPPLDTNWLTLSNTLAELVPPVSLLSRSTSSSPTSHFVVYTLYGSSACISLQPHQSLTFEPAFFKMRSGPRFSSPDFGYFVQRIPSTISRGLRHPSRPEIDAVSVNAGEAIRLPFKYDAESEIVEHKARFSIPKPKTLPGYLSEFLTRFVQSTSLTINIGVDDNQSVTTGIVFDDQTQFDSFPNPFLSYWPPIPASALTITLRLVIPTPKETFQYTPVPFKEAMGHLKSRKGQGYLYQDPDSRYYIVSSDPDLAGCDLIRRYTIECSFNPPPALKKAMFFNQDASPWHFDQDLLPKKLSVLAALQKANPRKEGKMENLCYPSISKILLWTAPFYEMLPPRYCESVYQLDLPCDKLTHDLVDNTLSLAEKWMVVCVVNSADQISQVLQKLNLLPFYSSASDRRLEIYVIASSVALFEIFFNQYQKPVHSFWLPNRSIAPPLDPSLLKVDPYELHQQARIWLFDSRQWTDAFYHSKLCPLWELHENLLRDVTTYFGSCDAAACRIQGKKYQKITSPCGATTLLSILRVHLQTMSPEILIVHSIPASITQHTLILLDDLDKFEPVSAFPQSPYKIYYVQIANRSAKPQKNRELSLLIDRASIPSVCNKIKALFPEHENIICAYQTMATESREQYSCHLFLLLAAISHDHIFPTLQSFVRYELENITISAKLKLKQIAFRSLFSVGERRYVQLQNGEQSDDYFVTLLRPCSLLHRRTFRPNEVAVWHSFMAEIILDIFPWNTVQSSINALRAFQVFLNTSGHIELPALVREFLSNKAKSPFLHRVARASEDGLQILYQYEQLKRAILERTQLDYPELVIHLEIAQSRLLRYVKRVPDATQLAESIVTKSHQFPFLNFIANNNYATCLAKNCQFAEAHQIFVSQVREVESTEESASNIINQASKLLVVASAPSDIKQYWLQLGSSSSTGSPHQKVMKQLQQLVSFPF